MKTTLIASTIHGVALSAWAFAGLTGNQMAALIKTITGSVSWVFAVTLMLYVVAITINLLLIKKPHQVKE